jgi:hypothetical protein
MCFLSFMEARGKQNNTNAVTVDKGLVGRWKRKGKGGDRGQ